MAFTRVIPSGSTDGNGVKVTGTGTGSTVTFHTAHSTNIDEVHLWAYNDDTQERTLTLEVGGTTDPDNLVVISVPPQAGLTYVLPGWNLTNSKTVKAFASTANVIVLSGYVNRLS
jgi:hypothetical protein